MTETFVAVRDAIQRTAAPTYGVVLEQVPDLPRPWYLPEPPPTNKSQGAALMDALAAEFPDNVKGWH